MHDDDSTSNPHAGSRRTLEQIIQRRLSRRAMLKGTVLTGAAISLPGLTGCTTPSPASTSDSAPDSTPAATFNFPEVGRGMDETHHVAEGHSAEVLIRWGDPLFVDSPPFNPHAQSASAQRQQFGYNCDFVGFHPLPHNAAGQARGLLCVNHEYTAAPLMLPDVITDYPNSMTQALCEIEMAAHGGSICEIVQVDGRWQVNLESPLNRRIFGRGTSMTYTGPAAGSTRLATGSDPSAREGTGTINNCAGGITPWGTYLMAEENFHGYFQGSLDASHAEAGNHERYGVPGGWFQWGRHFDEFNIAREPNAPNRYGWVVEVDILDPQSTPKKRTALGRFKHEGAESVIASDGRVVIYMGDDERFEYVYKFVSDDRFDADDRAANLDLLDRGTLFVARFNEDGQVEWLPLTFGQGPLSPENGFASQADVVIEARRAADLLGATPMDRPEDVEAQPDTGRVFVMLTNNTKRQPDQVDAANPRAQNAFGHIVEIITPDGDHTARTASWELLVQCGDPSDPAVGATWNTATSADGWFGSPDNCAFDADGRLWVATDCNPTTGAADGLWAMESSGALRGTGYSFFRAPVGAELCGPRFTPDGTTLFVAVQHPGDGPGATFDAPTTRWPDFAEDAPPRPSVVAIYKDDGGKVGS